METGFYSHDGAEERSNTFYIKELHKLIRTRF